MSPGPGDLRGFFMTPVQILRPFFLSYWLHLENNKIFIEGTWQKKTPENILLIFISEIRFLEDSVHYKLYILASKVMLIYLLLDVTSW